MYIQLVFPQFLSEEFQKRRIGLSKYYSGILVDPILTEDYRSLKFMIFDIIKNDSEIKYIIFSTKENEIPAHTFSGNIPENILSSIDDISKSYNNITQINTQDKNILHVSMPVIDGDIGILHFGISTEEIQKSISKIKNAILILLIITMILVIIVAIPLSYNFTSPIKELSESVKKIASGNLHVRSSINKSDELGVLANSFNIMAESLQSSAITIKEKEKALINTNNFINNIINSMPSIIIGLDNQRKITHWNTFVESQTNLNFKQVKGKYVGDIFPYLKNHLNDIQLAIKEKHIIKIKRMTIDVKNEQQYLDMMIYPLNSNHIEGVILRADNVTEQVRLEESLRESEQKYRALSQELEQKVIERTADLDMINEELTDFAYIVSHDLKAPLRAVSQLTEWIVADYSKKIDEEGKKMFGLLTSRIQRMFNLIEGILHYSRIGRLKEKREIIQTETLIRETAEALSPQQNICINIDENLPEICADRIRIAQVFQNLIDNAVKFLDKPEGKIEIGYQENSGFWQFHVSDNGPGIEQEYYEKIFKIFQTLQPRDQQENTGVGLAIVKKIVEQYDGKVWLESEVGKGSTFYFTIKKIEEF